MTDLTARERFAIAPVVMLCLVLGLFAQPLIDVSPRDANRLAQMADEARTRARVADGSN